jgi:hypothetical protein
MHHEPDTKLVSVFKTDDPAVLPLATMALEAEGIEYVIKNSGKADTMDWVMSQKPTSRPIVVEIVVAPDNADKARDLLVDLQQPTPPASVPETSAPDPLALDEPPSVRLEDGVTGALVGAITESQLQEITSRLEEEGPQQYLITGATVDMLQEANVDPALVDLLRRAVGADGSGVVLRWTVR